MNDITTSTPSSDSPSSAPATAPSTPPLEPASPEMLDQLAAPEDASAYAEERAQQEGQTEQQVSEPKKRLNRYERLKKARDAAQAEAAALREQSVPSDDGSPDAHAAGNGQQPPETYQPTPEEQAEVHQRLQRQMAGEIAARATYSERERQFAAQVPDYHAAMQNVADIEISDHLTQQLRESSYGPLIAYAFAASVDGLEHLMALREADPITTAKWVAKAEAHIEHAINQQQRAAPPQYQQQRRVTQARKPIVPLRGSAGPSRSTADLAENMEAYAQQRLRQMKAKRE
jgi:hypothetical protein